MKRQSARSGLRPAGGDVPSFGLEVRRGAALFFAAGAWYARSTRYTEKGPNMPTLKLKKGEIKVPTTLVTRMARRMHKAGNETWRQNYIARARKRLEAGHPGKNDAAVVLAAGG